MLDSAGTKARVDFFVSNDEDFAVSYEWMNSCTTGQVGISIVSR